MTPTRKEPIVAATSKERSKAINNSYSQASQALIKAHSEEFNSLRKEILREAGIDWSPPLTQEQKDEKALMDIIARSPSLLDKVTDGQNVRAPRQGVTVDPHS
jgi:hypothetical protein